MLLILSHLKNTTAPKMRCTIDRVISNEDTGLFCNQWRSKQKYNGIVIGGNSKFELLYIDLEIFGTRFENGYIEGGIRPPNVVGIGVSTVSNLRFDIDVSIQWDIGFYQDTISIPGRGQYYFNLTKEN